MDRFINEFANHIPVVQIGKDSKIKLSPEEAYLLGQVNGKMTTTQLVKLLHFPEQQTVALLLQLLQKKALTWATPTIAEAEILDLEPIENIPNSNVQENDFTTVQRLIEAYRHRLAKKDPFSFLDVTPQMSDTQIRKAFISLSRKLHPDRYYHLNISTEIKNELERLYSYLQEAYRQINSQQARLQHSAPKQTLNEKYGEKFSRQPISNANRLIELAQEAVHHGQYDAAITNFKLAAQLGQGPSYLEYAEALGELKIFEQQAQPIIEEGLPVSPEQRDYLLKLAARIEPILPHRFETLYLYCRFFYQYGKDYSLVNNALTKLLEYEHTFELLSLAAKILIKHKRFEMALNYLNEAKKIAPREPEIGILMEQIKQQLKKTT